MIGVRYWALGASLLVAAAAASAEPAPVGSLCNAEHKIEVFQEVSKTSCAEDPEQEMKALFKARAEYQDSFGLSPEKRAQINARIDRRIRELRKLKESRKSA